MDISPRTWNDLAFVCHFLTLTAMKDSMLTPVTSFLYIGLNTAH